MLCMVRDSNVFRSFYTKGFFILFCFTVITARNTEIAGKKSRLIEVYKLIGE